MDTFTCSRCGITKPVNEFPIVRSRINGTRCNACQAELRRIERAAKKASEPPKPPRLTERDRTSKRCNVCNIEKPVSEFYWNVRRYSSACKACRLHADWMNRGGYIRLAPADRFWSLVDKRSPDECWPWQGQLTKQGYGEFYVGGEGYRSTTAQRAAYEFAVGPIPEGMEIDHTCHTKSCKLTITCPHRRCCNPHHLEAVPRIINVQRSNAGNPGTLRPKAHKDMCIHGHPYDTENTGHFPNGAKYCLRCARQRYDKRNKQRRILRNSSNRADK